MKIRTRSKDDTLPPKKRCKIKLPAQHQPLYMPFWANAAQAVPHSPSLPMHRCATSRPLRKIWTARTKGEHPTCHQAPFEQTAMMSCARSVNAGLTCDVSVAWRRGLCWRCFSRGGNFCLLLKDSWGSWRNKQTAFHPNVKGGGRRRTDDMVNSVCFSE